MGKLNARRHGAGRKGRVFIAITLALLTVAISVAAIAVCGKGLRSLEPEDERTKPDADQSAESNRTAFPYKMREPKGSNGSQEPLEFLGGDALVMLSLEAVEAGVTLDIQEEPSYLTVPAHAGYPEPARLFRVLAYGPDGGLFQGRGTNAVTISVKLTEQGSPGFLRDPFGVTVQRYDETSATWARASYSLDLPWLRIEATLDALGAFAIWASSDVDLNREVNAETAPAGLRHPFA